MAVVNFRTDPETDAALTVLQADGTDKSEAIRRAVKAAARQRTIEQLRAAADRVRNDPDDLAEARAVQEDMAALRVW